MDKKQVELLLEIHLATWCPVLHKVWSYLDWYINTGS